MNITPFLELLFSSFISEIHSSTVEELQREIAECFLTYFGQFKDGELFILDNNHLSKLSPYELSEELSLKEKEIGAYLEHTKSLKLSTQLLYNGIHVLPDISWVHGGLRQLLADVLSHKVSFVTFPVCVEFTPDINLSYDLSVTLTNTLDEGIILSVKPNSVIEKESKTEKKYTGYYASEDGTIDAEVVINKFNLNFNLGNVIKYCIRAGKKDPSKHIEDLNKAKKYIEYEISRIIESSNS